MRTVQRQSCRRRWVCAGALAVTLALVRRDADAQQRDRQPEATSSPVPTVQPRCALSARPLAPQIPASSPDARIAPAALFTDAGMLVAWRGTDARLYLARVGPRFERIAEDRELGRPGGPFALVASEGGAALALVEQSPRGGAVLLLARLSASGEARNVPREIARADSIDAVGIAWTGTGYAIAWSTRGTSSATFVVLTDARGVPQRGPHRLLDATLPRIAYLPGMQSVVIAATGSGGEPTIAVLDEEGLVSDSNRWPSSARTLTPSFSGGTALGLGLRAEREDAATLTLTRWLPGAPTSDTDVTLRLAPGSSIASVLPDRGGLIAAIDEPSGRELITRVGSDGITTLLAIRPGWLGTLAQGADGALTVVGHEPPPAGSGRLALVQIICPRAPTPVAPSAASTMTSGTTTVATSTTADAGNNATAGTTNR